MNDVYYGGMATTEKLPADTRIGDYRVHAFVADDGWLYADQPEVVVYLDHEDGREYAARARLSGEEIALSAVEDIDGRNVDDPALHTAALDWLRTICR